MIQITYNLKRLNLNRMLKAQSGLGHRANSLKQSASKHVIANYTGCDRMWNLWT